MRIKAIFLLIALMLGSTLIIPESGRAEDSALLEKILTSGNKEELESYRKLLVELEKAKLKAKDLAGSTSAKLKIIKIDRELAALESATDGSGAAIGAGADKTAAEKANTVKTPVPTKAAAGKADEEKAAAEKAAAEKTAAEKAAAEKAAAEKAAAEKAAAEKAAAEKAAAEKAAAEKAAAEKAAAEKAAAEKAAAEQAAAEQAAAEQARIEQNKKAAELDKKIKELIAQGNAKLSAGDLQGARAIKKEISKAQAERDALGSVGPRTDKGAVATNAEVASSAADLTTSDLQNYRHLLGAWEREKNRSLVRADADQEKVLDDYRRKLIALGAALLKVNNIEGASAVKDEITTVTLELDDLHRPAPASKPAPVAAPEPPVPVPAVVQPLPSDPVQGSKVIREPRTLVSEVQGLAGATNFSENNVYSFNLTEVGPTSTLTFYVTGRRSTDSTGNVWLITPEGRREKVGKWRSSLFTAPASGVNNYSKLKPITENISTWVKTPGTYQVEFEWTGGIDPLVIFRVEITS